MKQCIIMQGVSGSGKSTLARKLLDMHWDLGGRIVSADFYWKSEGGDYDFDPKLLPKAHAYCIRCFVDAVIWQRNLVIVDNTNTTVEEIAPYYAIAEAYGYETKILRVYCDTQIAMARNVHSVPANVVQAQSERIGSFVCPPRWKLEIYTQSTQDSRWDNVCGAVTADGFCAKDKNHDGRHE